jgi:hypothetical protein
MRRTLVVVVLLAAVTAPPAGAVVVELPASRDNTLYESATGALSNGAGQFFFAGRNGTGQIHRGVVRFDVAAAVPPGATVLSATVRLFYDNTLIAANGTRVVSLRRLAADWGEGTSDASGQEGGGAASTTNDATWIHRQFNTVSWTTAGGDFAGTTSASQTVGITAGAFDWSDAALVADVQSMLDAPAGNFGWIVIGDESVASTAKRFATRENPTTANRPKLIVDYRPEGVPALPGWGAPALASLLVATALAFGRRRVTA